MGYILEVNGLTKIYPAFELKPVSFHIKAGEVMGFIGRNGAGKTTTLKSVLNLVHPDAGSIRILGMDYPDPVSRDEINEIFRKLAEKDVAILFSTHITSDLEKCADTITYIKNGELLLSAKKEDFIRYYGEETGGAPTLEDITYTVMLPVKKRDVVKAKYLFVLVIEFMTFILCTLLTIIRMKSLGNAAPYVTNQLMNANVTYLGYVMLVFAAFNSIFISGFFKTTYKIGKPFIIFCAVSFIIITLGEILHHIPGLESLNDTSSLSIPQAVILAIGVTVFILGAWSSYKKL